MDNTVLGYLRLQTKDFYKMLKAIARKKKYSALCNRSSFVRIRLTQAFLIFCLNKSFHACDGI